MNSRLGGRGISKARQERADKSPLLISDIAATLGRPHSKGRQEMRWGKNGGLSVRHEGTVVIEWFDHSECVGGGPDSLARRLGLRSDPDRPRSPPRPATARQKDTTDQEARIARALVIFKECRPIRDTTAGEYLGNRGIIPCDDMPDLGFHPGLWFPTIGTVPALVALMRDVVTGEPCGVHRTPLKADGSGRAGDRLMLGRARHAAVMLDSFEEVTAGVVLAEGIESAMSARQIGMRPAWATLSATNLRNFPLLHGVEALTVFADNDEAGLSASKVVRDRWAEAGREVWEFIPQPAGTDPNDLLRQMTRSARV